MYFEIYRKRGKGWEYLGKVNRTDSLKAAHYASYVYHIKVVGVRPEDSQDKILVHRLNSVALLSYA